MGCFNQRGGKVFCKGPESQYSAGSHSISVVAWKPLWRIRERTGMVVSMELSLQK